MAIDILAIQPQVISRDLRSKYLLLAGPPKIGKTEFCTMAPDALVLAFEIGTNARPGAMIQKIDTWSTFKLVLRQLEKPEAKAKFSTICIDTVAIAYDLCEQFICAQNGVQKISDIPWGGGYSASKKEFEASLRKITQLGYGVVLIAHNTARIEKTADGQEIEIISPDLPKRAAEVCNGIVDIIGYIGNEYVNGEYQRWLYTRETPTLFAGSRFKYLAPKIEFGYEQLVSAISDAIDEAEKNGATVVDKMEQVVEEELDYDSLMAEARELWTKLVHPEDNGDEEMARKKKKKLEMTFGRQIKLSEITEDQVSLLELAVIDMRDLVNN